MYAYVTPINCPVFAIFLFMGQSEILHMIFFFGIHDMGERMLAMQVGSFFQMIYDTGF